MSTTTFSDVGHSTADTLAHALWWRFTKEGIASALLLPLILGLFLELVTPLTMLPAAGSSGAMPVGGGFHGAPPNFSALGAHSSSIVVMVALLGTPAAMMTASGLAAGMGVSSILASELNSGAAELWLSRLSPRAIIAGLVGIVFALVGIVWLAMVVLTIVFIAILVLALRVSVTLTVGYVLLCALVPLVLSLGGAALAVGVGLWKPKLAQVSNGIVHGVGVVLILIALLPCLIVGIAAMTAIPTGVSITLMGGIGLGLAIILAILAVLVGVTRISRENMVSSL